MHVTFCPMNYFTNGPLGILSKVFLFLFFFHSFVLLEYVKSGYNQLLHALFNIA